MLWSALGFGATNLIQANAGTSIPLLYFADFIDGITSCMLPLCQAYVADCSLPEDRAVNLGIFQGMSAAGAFILAFPIAGILGAKYGPRFTLMIAAGIQALNAAIIILFTPESNTSADKSRGIDWKRSNPIGGLVRLFGGSKILRVASMVYLLASLARTSLDSQFPNYTNIRFGWTQAQSGPVLVLVGLMLAVAPPVIVPRIGLNNSITFGLFVFALGLIMAGLVPTSGLFVASIGVVAVGCVCLPANQALLANLAPPGERGALLGAVGSLNELMAGIGSTLYASLLAAFATNSTPENPSPLSVHLPGMQFIVAGAILLIAWSIALPGLSSSRSAQDNDDKPAL